MSFPVLRRAMTPPKDKYIIYLEDDADDVEIFKEYFGHLDHLGIVIFSNGLDLLEYLSMMPTKGYPCIIVLDINVPKMSGWDTVAALRTNENWKHIPVVMFSTSNAMQERKRELYSVDVVTKPINSKEAKGIAEKLLGYCNNPNVKVDK